MVTGIPVHAGGPGSGSEIQARAADRSSSGMLALTGEETVDFLQRISTNDCSALVPGAAVQTVLTDEKGRIVDSVIAAHAGESVLLVTSAGRAEIVKAWLERFIIMEDITVRSETGIRACAVVIGSSAETAGPISAGAAETNIPAADAGAKTADIMSFPLAFHSVPSTLILSDSHDALAAYLSSHSIPIMSQAEYYDFRVRFGIPEAGREITEKTNPLEAGLRGLVDFTKGCYIGQEVIARLSTYEKVQRRLCRVRLSERPAAGEKPPEIIGEEGVHGYITTIGHAPNGDGTVDALAVLKSSAASVDASYRLGEGHIDVHIIAVL